MSISLFLGASEKDASHLFFEILSSLISYLFVTNIRIGDNLIFALISQFFWTIPFIITVSCLSYTYIRYQEGTKI